MDVTILSDLVSGKEVYRRYKEYMESQWFSRSDLETIQLRKLEIMLDHCYQNVPFYRNAMLDKGLVPSDFTTLEMLKELPVVTKEVIKQNYNDFMPKNMKLIKRIKRNQTSGTTGGVLLKQKCANARSSSWGAYKRFETWMGFKTGERALILMGGHVIHKHGIREAWGKISSKAQNIARNRVSINPYNNDDSTTDRIIAIMTGQNIKLIRSYSQYLYNLCQLLQKRNLRMRIPLVTTTAEPLMPEHRALFKTVLGADSFDQYGCGEIGGISFECDRHEGMHITEEHVVVEHNEFNDLIVTDLDNYAMPFIRYHNADQAILKSEKCSCGREHRLIEKVMGRTCDYVIGIDGQFLHWAYFWHLIFDSGIANHRDLIKFQVVQEERNRILFRYVASKLSDDEMKAMTENIQSHMGDVRVEFIQESEIPNTSTGKYRPVINKLLVQNADTLKSSLNKDSSPQV